MSGIKKKFVYLQLVRLFNFPYMRRGSTENSNVHLCKQPTRCNNFFVY